MRVKHRTPWHQQHSISPWLLATILGIRLVCAATLATSWHAFVSSSFPVTGLPRPHPRPRHATSAALQQEQPNIVLDLHRLPRYPPPPHSPQPFRMQRVLSPPHLANTSAPAPSKSAASITAHPNAAPSLSCQPLPRFLRRCARPGHPFPSLLAPGAAELLAGLASLAVHQFEQSVSKVQALTAITWPSI